MFSVRAHNQVASGADLLFYLAIIKFSKLNLNVFGQNIHSPVHHRSYCSLPLKTTSSFVFSSCPVSAF